MTEENNIKSSILQNNIFKLDEIIMCRVPPIFWEIIGYVLSLYSFFSSNYNLGYFMIVMISIYFSCNYFFDSLTMMIDLNEPQLKINFETTKPTDLKWYHKLLDWIKL